MGKTLDSFREEMKDETLKDEEDTSTATGEAEENETETTDDASSEAGSEENDMEAEEDTSTNEAEEAEATEEKVTLSKAEYDKVIKERDNYKQGMLSAKAKKRGLQITDEEQPKVDLNEKVVMGVLEKQSEKAALRNTINSKHGDYIPELVDDANYQEIVAYLPRSMDKSDYGSIVKSLKIATRMWKEDKGINYKSPKKDTGLQTSKTSTVSGSKKEAIVNNRFKSNKQDYLSWYKK
ncbi:MAG: hypothetical protein ABIJ40_09480 [Bacteroidota bacterium]